MSVTAGRDISWLTKFANCVCHYNSLKSRISTLDSIVNDEKVICRDLIQDHVIAPLKRVLRALTAAQRQTRANNSVVPESFKTLLRDLAAEACNLVVLLERLCNETRLIQLLRNDNLAKHLHQTRVGIETFLRGVQQLRDAHELPAGFESADLRPNGDDDDERLQIRCWRDLVHASCATEIDDVLQRALETPSTMADRCAVRHEWYRLDRLDVLLPALRDHEDAIRQYLTAGNTRELERQLMQFFVPSFELVVRGYLVDGSDIQGVAIGAGRYGIVYQAEYNRTAVAVKRLFAKHFSRDLLLNELSIWSTLRHPNVLQFIGATSLDEKCWIVSELAGGNNLISFTKSNSGQTWRLLHEAALGIAYLHAMDVVHADLRCGNILVGSDGQARVADFGLSFRVAEGDNVQRTESHQWRAPECIKNETRSFPIDMYMFGMTIIEACFGRPPYGNTDDSAIRKHVTKGLLPPLLDTLSSEVQTLVRAMCALEPADRIPMVEVIAQLEVFKNEELPSKWDGNLVDFLQRTPANKRKIWRLVLDAANKLSSLHDNGVVHGNLRCDNILVKDKGSALLCDLVSSHACSHTMSARWMAPECVLYIGAAADPSFASDVYSLGMCIIEAKTGKMPWAVVSDDGFINELVYGNGYPRPDNVFSDDEWDLVQGMTAFDVSDRKSLAQVIETLQELANAPKRDNEEEAREDDEETVAPAIAPFKCPDCETLNAPYNTFCGVCGYRLKSDDAAYLCCVEIVAKWRAAEVKERRKWEANVPTFSWCEGCNCVNPLDNRHCCECSEKLGMYLSCKDSAFQFVVSDVPALEAVIDAFQREADRLAREKPLVCPTCDSVDTPGCRECSACKFIHPDAAALLSEIDRLNAVLAHSTTTADALEQQQELEDQLPAYPCSRCGELNPEDEAYCRQCGFDIEVIDDLDWIPE